MKYMKLRHGIILAAVVILAYTSCQKVIDLKLNNAAPQLVIEGNVTDYFALQRVVISKSVPFTSTNVFPPVSGAIVSIKDERGINYAFRESSPGTYLSVPFRGVYGMSYTLTVQTGGVTYTATSTMPYVVNLDSLTAKIDAFDKKNTRTITVNYQDPPNIANQYRFVMAVNSTEVGTIFTNDDSFTDGRYVRSDLFQSGTDILAGDTAAVEMQCIDEPIFKYWYSLSQQQGNGPGGGTAPSNPPSNIDNNALGYFSAHTSQVKSIVVE